MWDSLGGELDDGKGDLLYWGDDNFRRSCAETVILQDQRTLVQGLTEQKRRMRGCPMGSDMPSYLAGLGMVCVRQPVQGLNPQGSRAI